MTSLAAIDLIRYGHLLFVAVGLGAAVVADLSVLRRLRQPVTSELLDQMLVCHRLVWAGVFGMWLTGLALIYVRTGFVLDEFTPKLVSKLLVVLILTVNAVLIGRFAMPLLSEQIGARPDDLPLGSKLIGGLLVSISSASWLMALAHGESAVLAQSSWEIFQRLVPAIYGSAMVAGVGVVMAHHAGGQFARWRRAVS